MTKVRQSEFLCLSPISPISARAEAETFEHPLPEWTKATLAQGRGSDRTPRSPSAEDEDWIFPQPQPTYGGRSCGVREECIPGALSISKGAVPGLVRGLGHMAPTYVVGSRDR